MYYSFRIPRCRHDLLRSHKYLVSCIRRGIGSAINFACVCKGIICYVSGVLVVPSIPLSFHVYYLFRIGGVDNTLDFLYKPCY